ncbi:sigma-54-dependent Fis family transcriptional regulator [Desulfobacter hydrogenophilus]|uniref:Sigma-54-dependent Fis family transcriptional regulator n=1 Tax=Desulfobacter hydrogenophilus TaxID=2291 RepID=A0A328FAG4_9BACT|nr:sigma-54 dependent transcriptional regulator [Desulfobacter hydrogenophilus]NDY71308.1 sigma-54-dependent Fis family transcriptional regulator [Desulfobacter hydrogenophilus]QBH12290.1 sigma-54-dependent Fis family transcriptional regulator [Desulfobacter hydrogenophilus]RAM01196.1 sigma-54-dependent Fis family transcriptional regulator [Desulfobacter hydrogenophilus]
MAKILIIDDDEDICYSLSRLVRHMNHEADCATTLQEGLEKVKSEDIDVLFLDIRMPDGNGLDILPQLQALPDAPEVIISTGYADADGAELAIKSGAWDYIEKTASIKAIRLALSRALQYRKEKKAAPLADVVMALQHENIIGDSPQIRSCLDMVAQAALSDINVLITGETGTGKELFAQAIHNNSARSKNSLVVVDCAALPDTLVESLLFGHLKGSFTGADKDRNGLIRQADGGTLFLDEVGELPLSLQKAFLRVLQEHRFRPIGSKSEIKSDFRLVAATNRNLESMVTEGTFRKDLLYRISAFTLNLPALKERPADIKALARFHSDRLCERTGIAPKGFSSDFFDVLAAYSWPGNIRELINTMDRTLTAARYEPTLFPKHLPPQIRIQAVRQSVAHPHQPAEEKPTDTNFKIFPPLQDFREAIYTQAEQQYLADLMDITDGNIKEAIRISGLSQSRLYTLLKKHNIKRHL